MKSVKKIERDIEIHRMKANCHGRCAKVLQALLESGYSDEGTKAKEALENRIAAIKRDSDDRFIKDNIELNALNWVLED
jgi:20S proteasome alpha/beta subunit